MKSIEHSYFLAENRNNYMNRKQKFVFEYTEYYEKKTVFCKL